MTSVVALCREGPDNHRSCPTVKRILNCSAPEAPRLHGSETQQPHKSATDKRPRGSPTWETPLQTCERRPAVGSSRQSIRKCKDYGGFTIKRNCYT